MILPPIPENESERLKELIGYSILDTLPEKEYDDITMLASQICQTPISLVSLIDFDRQWFKSHHGIGVSEAPRELAFCAHAISHPNDVLMVPDSRKDDRFKDNPLVTGAPNVIFYTGVPLVSNNGFSLGTLCVIDNKPNSLNEEQINSLKALSNQVVRLFELRKSKQLLELANAKLEHKCIEIELFAKIAAHDLKSPLGSISNLIELILEDNLANLDQDAIDYLKLIEHSASSLRSLVDGILAHSKSDKLINEQNEEIQITSFFEDIVKLFKYENVFIDYPIRNKTIKANKVALQQVLINLISNSIKYNDKEFVNIELEFNEDENEYEFAIKDNGIGIAKVHQSKIFNLFEVITDQDRFGNKGNGIGLSTVKKLIDGMGGTIKVESVVNKGTKIKFSIAK